MATTITANGINFPDGSAGSPSIGGSDTNTGLFTGADIIGFSTGGSERLRIDSDGRLLLGTTTPGNSTADDLTIATSSNTGITLRSATNGEGNIFFGDGTSGADQYRGMVRYFHNDDALAFNAAGSERMRIDSSGRVGIGTTNPDTLVHVKNTSASPLQRFESLHYNSYIGTAQANDNAGNGSKAGNLVLRGQTGVAIMGNNGTTTQVKIDADGLKFNNDTAAANALDEYEEGSFTPAVAQGTTNTQTFDSTSRYVKIGKIVHCQLLLQYSGVGNNAHMKFSGLPFTSANNTSRGGGTVLWTNIPNLNDMEAISAIVEQNATTLALYHDMDSTAGAGSSGFTNKAIYIRLTYEAA